MPTFGSLYTILARINRNVIYNSANDDSGDVIEFPPPKFGPHSLGNGDYLRRSERGNLYHPLFRSQKSK